MIFCPLTRKSPCEVFGTHKGERVRRIGVLMALPANDPEVQARVAAFLQGLQELGWSVGRNVIVDIHHQYARI
jgi:hypothetical protein